jgi:hypothetical protein
MKTYWIVDAFSNEVVLYGSDIRAESPEQAIRRYCETVGYRINLRAVEMVDQAA